MTNITLDDLLNDLQKAKAIAERNENPNALISATLAQAKLLGLEKPEPKQLDNELTINIVRVGADDAKTTYHS